MKFSIEKNGNIFLEGNYNAVEKVLKVGPVESTEYGLTVTNELDTVLDLYMKHGYTITVK